MEFTEITITVAEPEISDILVAELSSLPFEGFEQQDESLKAYIKTTDLNKYRTSIDEITRGLGLGLTESPIEDKNWNSEWESNFDPVFIDGQCLVRAPFHAPSTDGSKEIVIMPKMSFGTGHHATTHLMVSEILSLDLHGLRGLDMGSGTGILSIAAVMAGAYCVDAIDIDSWAYENSIENYNMNGVGNKVMPILGDISAVPGKDYDFILANINRNILIEDLAGYAGLCKSGGLLVMSGILEADIADISTCAESSGFTVTGSKTRNGWSRITCRKR